MCISREHFNMCKCGCPEIVHEGDFITGMIAEAAGFLPQGRGKCNGLVYLPLNVKDIEDAIARGEKPIMTKPCECLKFVPAFKSMCDGMGADKDDDIFGRNLG